MCKGVGTMKPRKERAFSLVEILVTLAIIAIVAGLSYVSGRRQLTNQEENSVVSSFQQIILEGTTAASSRGVKTILFRDEDKISLLRSDNNEELSYFELPSTVTTNLASRGELLAFSPHGWVDEVSLSNFPSPLEIRTSDKTYDLKVSLIGEVDVEVR